MAEFTRLSSNDLEVIRREFDIGKINECSSFGGGAANSSFLVKADGIRYVISVRDEKSLEGVQAVAEVLLLLGKYDLPTERLIPMQDGHYVMNFHSKPLIVKKYVEGVVPNSLDAAALEILGRSLGLLHQIPPPVTLRTTHPYGLESFAELFMHTKMNEFTSWLKDKYDFIIDGIPSGLLRGLIHGDLFHDNVIMREGKPVAILDFEEACNYFLIFDLGMAGAGSCQRDGAVALDLVRALIEGYQQVRPLESEEKEVLQLFIEYSAVATAFWRFRQYNIRHSDHRNTEKHLQMRRIADQIHVIQREEFFSTIFLD